MSLTLRLHVAVRCPPEAATPNYGYTHYGDLEVLCREVTNGQLLLEHRKGQRRAEEVTEGAVAVQVAHLVRVRVRVRVRVGVGVGVRVRARVRVRVRVRVRGRVKVRVRVRARCWCEHVRRRGHLPRARVRASA